MQELAPLLEEAGCREQAWIMLQEAAVHAVREYGANGQEIVADWVSSKGSRLTESELHRLANRVAWILRDRATELPPSLELTDRKQRFTVYLLLERKRFMFSREGVAEVLVKYHLEEETDSPLVRAYRQFLALTEATSLSDAAQQDLDDVWQAAQESGVGDEVFDIILHALWLAHRLERQGHHLLDYSDRWGRSAVPNTGVLHFRRATALRLVGRFEEAIQEAEKAMQMTTGSPGFAEVFVEQCLRERALGVAAMSIQSTVERGRAELDDLRRQLEVAERRSIARTIEVVTLFMVAAAFAIGAINIVGMAADSTRSALVLLGGFGGGLVAFAAIIVASLVFLNQKREGNRDLSTRQWLVFFAVLAAVMAIQVFLPILASGWVD